MNENMSRTLSVASIPTDLPEQASAIVPLDEIENPIVREGLAYWRKLCGARAYPSRTDLRPRDFVSMLRHVVLLRLIDGGRDYEYRIVGDAHVVSHGFCMQGLRVSNVDSVSPGYGPVLKKLYDRAVRRRDAFAFRGWLERGDQEKKYIYSESVFMPLGPDQSTIDHVLNFSVYIPRGGYVI
jgi:hypothetical protein